MFNDVKHMGSGRPYVPALRVQVLLVVAGFAAGVLVNQHFTDRYVDSARAAIRAIHDREAAGQTCGILVQMDIDEEGE